MSIYDYAIAKPNGEELKLADFRGKVVLIVNTATDCGFTPQYETLEQIYEKFHDKGLKLKEKAATIPQALKGNIYLSYDEVVILYNLLNKNLKGIKEVTKKECL